MKYEYDAKKLAANVQNHKIWFHEANFFEWSTAVIRIDGRHSYPETRFEAIGYIDSRLYVLVFCLRISRVRIISLRKANTREVNRYANS
ncbi:MAG: BrnT family toxin [Burkholderiaceae bacterium]|nr:BrnT family toxin [Burkholderiaceae bacterium]